MRANRGRDTGPEVALRSALHARGLRFRKNYRLDLGDRRRVRPDVVFPKLRLAVFVDGCFWHGCPEHGVKPATNSDWWRWKLDRTQARDADTTALLEWQGWTVLRFWEHEAPESCADSVGRHWRALRNGA